MAEAEKIELTSEQETEFERQWKVLSFGVSEITPEPEFRDMLRHSIKEGKPLRVKCGIDPTGFDVHIGHLVPYKKMRQFQDLGHLGVVIIGDYTASIGDPTGKDVSRTSLTADQVRANARTYMDQVYTVLDRDRTEVCYQTEWFEEVGLRDIIGWAAETTCAKLLSHDTFAKRLEEGSPLALHELFYPVLQGIDSVFVKADVELGGSDQKFNVLMGRDYQKHRNMRPQVAMLLPIITGTCGSQKMSKSLNNYIAIQDDAFDKFGKIMSIPDELMADYFRYVSSLTREEIEQTIGGLEKGNLHPNETKKMLAMNVVDFFHGEGAGQEMREKFEAVFKKGGVPDDAPESEFERGALLVDILLEAGLLPSKKEARRMIQANAVGIVDGDKITDIESTLDDSYSGKVIKVGKRKFLKLK
ncbi:MAG: tyrosine--tRNA ligase [Bacteriovoracaceae bacterium]|nr:tyrosine--tRNA ligase [Bacteriovoracaceae bacterium]